MKRIHCLTFAGLTCLGLVACQTSTPPAPVTQAPVPMPGDEIVAARPVIPDAKFNLLDFGAVGNGKTFNTDAFKKAVAAIEQAGGGHLIVPAGTYKTLPFTLTSHMDLHLEPGSVIKAPETFADYGLPDPNQPLPPGSPPRNGGGRRPGGPGGGGFGRGGLRPLITGENITDVSVTGSGTIDGSGAEFWMWSDKAARRYPPGRRVVSRPHLITFNGVKRLLFDGVTLKDAPMYELVPSGDDMTFQNLRIVAPSDSPNTDAIDPSGHRIVIRDCEIDNGDDNVALHDGSSDILVEGLTCLHGHGISVGSGTRRGLSHVVVRNCTFDGTDNGLRIKSYRGGGGEVKDFLYYNITMKNVRRPFDINMRYNGNAGLATDVGPREAEPGQTNAIPNFHDIHIKNLTVTRSPIAGRIVGIPEMMPNAITFTNVKIQADRGFLVQDAKDGIVFDNVQIAVALGEPVVTANATMTLNGAVRTGDTGGSPDPFY
jgi:polygalacturonase